MRRQAGITKEAYAPKKDGRIWCVTVDHPDGLIVAQRALRVEGVVTKASRPVITGNCLRIMDNGSELSKTVATFIIQKILLDEMGLSYICATYERFHTVSAVLTKMVRGLEERPSVRLLKHIVRCFPESDTQVLTDAGFLFLHEIEARVAAKQPVLFASYSPASQQLSYLPGQIVFNNDPPTHLVEFVQPATRCMWQQPVADWLRKLPVAGVANEDEDEEAEEMAISPEPLAGQPTKQRAMGAIGECASMKRANAHSLCLRCPCLHLSLSFSLFLFQPPRLRFPLLPLRRPRRRCQSARRRASRRTRSHRIRRFLLRGPTKDALKWRVCARSRRRRKRRRSLRARARCARITFRCA
jgi:hypothetical protein